MPRARGQNRKIKLECFTSQMRNIFSSARCQQTTKTELNFLGVLRLSFSRPTRAHGGDNLRASFGTQDAFAASRGSGWWCDPRPRPTLPLGGGDSSPARRADDRFGLSRSGWQGPAAEDGIQLFFQAINLFPQLHRSPQLSRRKFG